MTLNKFLAGLIVVVVAVGGYFYFHPSKKLPAPSDQQTQAQNQQAQQNQNNSSTTSGATAGTVSNNQPTPNPTPVPNTTIATVDTNQGSFQITLDASAAPKTVANFVKLIKAGFYNGLTFHRIVKQTGFHLIQGGDPSGDGTGGPGYTVPAEIKLKHTRGAIAMARLGDNVNPNKDSSGSQFYIVEEDIPFLDGNYTVFGYVTFGMDVVDKIGAVPTGPNDMPTTPVKINKITIK
jgi:peptidyl-prolyl cis-trans isomerase B (cyclophilin B)